MDTDRVIGGLTARQWGVVARGQLLDAGLSRKIVANRVRSGHLLPLHPGVYAVGHRRLRREGVWLAAVLAAGPGAVLSHRDAAGLHDLRPANHGRIDISTTGRARSSAGITVHRTRTLDARDVTTVRGLPTTTVARTLVDLAGIVPRAHLARAIKEAELRDTFDLTAVEAAMARTRGRRGPGHRALREEIRERRALSATHTHSPLEDAFLRLLRGADLPIPATNANVEGLQVDAAWRAHRLVVELDGWQSHHTRHAFQHDRERDAILTAAGWRTVRFTHHHVTRRPDHVVNTLRRLGIG
jgi:very-short-patch-repair endonuclease